MAEHILQEQNVGLHASDLELVQSTLHLLYGVHIAVGMHNDLQQQVALMVRWLHVAKLLAMHNLVYTQNSDSKTGSAKQASWTLCS